MRALWLDAARKLFLLAALCGIFTGIEALGQLLLYGRVKW